MTRRLRAILRVIGLGVLWITLAGSSSCTTTPPQTVVDITILHTNDIHSHLRAEAATSEKNPFNLGGLARLKTLVDQIRAVRPNTILLDAGDWSEGIMPFAVDGGSNMLNIMDTIGYSAVVVGNHDFLNGVPELYNTIVRANPSFPVLGANKDLSALPNGAQIAGRIPPYAIVNVGGVKVGIIGLLTEDLSYATYFAPAAITSAIAAATNISTAMHDQKLADVIVLLSHNSFSTNVTWAKQVPWVNAVISGHSHLKTPAPTVVTNAGNPVYVAETKQWGQFLGDMTLTVNTTTGKVALKQFTLHPVVATLPEDPKVAALVSASEKALAAKFGVTDVMHDHLADCADELPHDDSREVPLGNLVADAYRKATNADLAMESVQLTGDGISQGPLSSFNLYNITPHIYGPIPGQSFPDQGRAWTLKNLKMSGVTLRGLLNLSFLAQGAGLMGHIALSGAQVTYLGSGGGASPVQTISVLNPTTLKYEAVQDQKTYSIATHDGLLTALGVITKELHLELDLSNYVETGIQAWSALTDFVVSLGTVHASTFQAGSRYRATTADLGFYEHDVSLLANPGNHYALSVNIRNEGLSASRVDQLLLRVLRSPPNDVNGDATGNERTPIASDIPVPPLAPGAQATVVVPWNDLPGPGLYSLQLELVGTDANAVNNSVLVHRIVPSN